MSDWNQPEMFPETTATWIESQLWLNQESQQLGFRYAIKKKNWPYQIGEGDKFFHFSYNGFCNVIDELAHAVEKTEATHGLILPSFELPRDGAPF